MNNYAIHGLVQAHYILQHESRTIMGQMIATVLSIELERVKRCNQVFFTGTARAHKHLMVTYDPISNVLSVINYVCSKMMGRNVRAFAEKPRGLL